MPLGESWPGSVMPTAGPPGSSTCTCRRPTRSVDPGAGRGSPGRSCPTREAARILRKLNQAEAFERFLHTKYVGHKRFGLEGAE